MKYDRLPFEHGEEGAGLKVEKICAVCGDSRDDMDVGNGDTIRRARAVQVGI